MTHAPSIEGILYGFSIVEKDFVSMHIAAIRGHIWCACAVFRYRESALVDECPLRSPPRRQSGIRVSHEYCFVHTVAMTAAEVRGGHPPGVRGRRRAAPHGRPWCSRHHKGHEREVASAFLARLSRLCSFGLQPCSLGLFSFRGCAADMNHNGRERKAISAFFCTAVCGLPRSRSLFGLASLGCAAA